MNEQEIKAGGWIVNEGKQPVEDDVLVDVMIDNIPRNDWNNNPANIWQWWFDVDANITHWRLHKEASVESSNNTQQEETSWIANNGTEPDVDGEVEISCANGKKSTGYTYEFFWDFMGNGDTITHWRECAKQSLETAYDVPPKPDNDLQKVLQESLTGDFCDKPESYYKAPETKYSAKKLIHLHKKSAEQQVVDIFNQATGNSLTEKNFKDMLELLDLINRIGE